MNPKLVAVLLVGGTFALGGGAAALAELPSPARSMQAAPATRPPAAAPVVHARAHRYVVPTVTPPVRSIDFSAPASESAAKSGATPSIVVVTTITYAVRDGDTPATIARWFASRGYGAVYDAQKSVIVDDPSRIRAGALVSISNGALTVQPPS